jgi:hypothetical protein
MGTETNNIRKIHVVLCSILFLLACVLFIIAIIESCNYNGKESVTTGNSPSVFTITILFLISILSLISSSVAGITINNNEESNNPNRVKQLSYSLAIISFLFFMHTLIEVIHGNPNFGLSQWLLTILVIILPSIWSFSLNNFVNNEIVYNLTNSVIYEGSI